MDTASSHSTPRYYRVLSKLPELESSVYERVGLNPQHVMRCMNCNPSAAKKANSER